MPGEREHETLRASVRSALTADLGRAELRLTGITFAATEAARAWTMPPRRVSWDWVSLIKRRRSGHFEVALWWEAQLCGLAYGKAGLGYLAMHYLEACPYPHPLKRRVLPLAVAALEAQALAQGLPETRLVDPFAEIEDRYLKRGYARVAEPDAPVYLVKRRALL